MAGPGLGKKHTGRESAGEPHSHPHEHARLRQAHAGATREEEPQLAAGRDGGGGDIDEPPAHEAVDCAQVRERVVVGILIGTVERVDGLPEHHAGFDEDPMPGALGQAQEEHVRLVDELAPVIVRLDEEASHTAPVMSGGASR
jgi:hypothetical protein